MGKNSLILDGIAFIKTNYKLSYKRLSIVTFSIVEELLFLHCCALQVTGERSTVQSIIWFSRERYLHVQRDSQALCSASTPPVPSGLGLLQAEDGVILSSSAPRAIGACWALHIASILNTRQK